MLKHAKLRSLRGVSEKPRTRQRAHTKLLFLRNKCAAVLAAVLLAVTPALPAQAAHSLPESSFTNYPDTILYYSPSVSADELYNKGVNYLLVPENVRKRLANDGVRIYLIAYQDEVLTSHRVSDYGDSRIGIAALTTHPTYRKYIYSSTGQLAYVERLTNAYIEIQTNVNSDTLIDPSRLIHEVGHFVDTAAGADTATYFAISSGKTFQNYYQQFGSEIVKHSAYQAAPSLYNAAECWADCFRMAYTEPDTLKSISPDLYNFVLTQTAALPVRDSTRSAG